MQDGYVGDIGDFARSGMLRELFGKPEATDSLKSPLRLGVVWCLNESGQIGNLTPDTYRDLRHLDCHLFDTLNALVVKKGRRRVSEFQREGLLNTQLYFCKPLSGLRRVERKEMWLEEAIKKTKGVDVVFADPDNGIATKDMTQKDAGKKSPLTKRNAKHIFIDELQPFFAKGKSIVIYQHLGQRNQTDRERIEDISTRLKQELQPKMLWALRWNHLSPRIFFILARKEHETGIKNQLEAFGKSEWARQDHFTEVEV